MYNTNYICNENIISMYVNLFLRILPFFLLLILFLFAIYSYFIDAAKYMRDFLRSTWGTSELYADIQALYALTNDTKEIASGIPTILPSILTSAEKGLDIDNGVAAISAVCDFLMSNDRKVAPLKNIQARIWYVFHFKWN
jgi:hypothetical protein